jgi:ABC-type multidrug transport system ATPase subunit
MLSQLQRSGVSIVLTTHHLEEAERRCERIVIIDHGKIVASGALAELMQSALGTSRTLTLTTSGRLPSSLPDGAVVDEAHNTVRFRVHNLGPEIVEAVTAVQSAGGQVTDLHLAGASLQDVFIALTGRELRE